MRGLPTAGGGYRTLRAGAEATGESRDRRSRFVAQLAHVESEAEAAAFVSRVRARRRDARHNVPAWVLADGRERTSDDGEPQHAAGLPTLGVLRAAGLADVCCVVTRYFGGTLLGPAGLARAYAAAVRAALSSAEEAGLVRQMALVTRVVAQVPYALYDRVAQLARDAGGTVAGSAFAGDVQLTLAFPAGDEAPFVSAVRELAAGEDLCRVGEPAFGEL